MKTTIKVSGMTCEGCVRSVTKVLQSVSGVSGVEVSLERGQAVVTHEPQQAPFSALKQAIEDAGYEAAETA